MLSTRARALGGAVLLTVGAAGCSAAVGEEASPGSTAESSGAVSAAQHNADTTASSTPTAEGSTSGQVRYLFVQSAESAAFRGSGDGEGMVLELVDVSSVTFAFTEEPYRDTGAVPTTQFVESFAERFPGASPNAVVSSVDAEAGEYPVELGAPTLSEDGRAVTYPVTPLMPDQQVPETTGPVSVFIDPQIAAAEVTVTGRVIDGGSGIPLAGASVRVATGPDATDTVASATTDTYGQYSISGGFSFGVFYYLTASAPNHLTSQQTVAFSNPTNNVEFVVPRA